MEETKINVTGVCGGLDITAANEAMLDALAPNPWQNEKTVEEIAFEMAQKAIPEELNKAIAKGQAEFKGKDFYVEIFIQQDPKLVSSHALPRAIVYPVCPTPTHEAAVWKIHGGTGVDEFLWMVPSVKEGLEMLNDPLNVTDKELFKDLLDFMDGTLRRRAKKLNGEI